MPATALIALGSNRRHGRHRAPRRVLDAAIARLAELGLKVRRRSRTWITDPVGPGTRRFANAAVKVETELGAEALLRLLKSVEAEFGRRRGRRWGDRVLDLDLLGMGQEVRPTRLRWRSARGFALPHRRLHERRFVLDPLEEIAPDWRHPVLGRTVRQLAAAARSPRRT